MGNASYVSLTRQSGLMRELQSVAQNIANMSTSGYRREAVIFSEYVTPLDGGRQAMSMAAARAHHFDLEQGTLGQTGGRFDLAIEGPGFFMVETGAGPALTRAGAFTANDAGELAASDGARLLDVGGAPVFVPPDARDISVAADGTLSADGRPLAQIGLFEAVVPEAMTRLSGARFLPGGPVDPAEGGAILQGFVEGSNVDPVTEIARMIEVQHAYEMGQNMLEREDERIRAVVQTLGK